MFIRVKLESREYIEVKCPFSEDRLFFQKQIIQNLSPSYYSYYSPLELDFDLVAEINMICSNMYIVFLWRGGYFI